MAREKMDNGGKKVVTSMKVDPKLWKKAKMRALERDISLYELVEIALKKEIGEE